MCGVCVVWCVCVRASVFGHVMASSAVAPNLDMRFLFCAQTLTPARDLPPSEGDRKASKETASAKIESNKRRIATLREENKNMVAQLRALKNPGKQKFGAGVSMKAVSIMDEKVCGLIKKHNQVRAEALRKEKELLQLQKEMYVHLQPV